MQKIGLMTLAVSISAALAGCPSDSPTRGSVCDDLAAAACTYAIRCETWDGTRADCERVQKHECCVSDGVCGEEVVLASGLFETCLAGIRGATCGSNPTRSDACRDAITVPADDDGGVDASDVDASMPPVDAGPPSRLYAHCSSGDACGVGESCYTLSYTTTDFACSMPCTDDTPCPRGHCVRTRTAPLGGTAMDGTPVCLESCSAPTDCTVAGWECVTTSSGLQVCLP